MKCIFKFEKCNGNVSYNGLNCCKLDIDRHLKRSLQKQTVFKPVTIENNLAQLLFEHY